MMLLRPHLLGLVIGILLTAASRVCSLVGPIGVKHLIDEVVVGRTNDILRTIAVMAASVLIGTILSQLGIHLLTIASNMFTADLRACVQSQLIRMPVAQHDVSRLGELLTRIMRDPEGLRMIVGEETTGRFFDVFEAIAGLTYMFYLSRVMGGICLALIMLGTVWVYWGYKSIMRLCKLQHRLSGELTAHASDMLNGTRTIKVYRAEDQESHRFLIACRNLATAAISVRKGISFVYGNAALVLGLTIPALAYVGTRQIQRGTLTLGEFSAIMLVVWRVIWPMISLVGIGGSVANGISSLDRVMESLGMPLEGSEGKRCHLLEAVRGDIEFDDVSFSYGDRLILHRVSFRAVPGTVTAIVGPSAAGKSTLLSLIACFYLPNIGTVKIDGIDLCSVDLNSYRKHIAFVMQNPFLFPGSIADNVLMARPSATTEEVISACQSVGIHQNGGNFDVHTKVGEQGILLSGGQKQRISIARAFLANPQVLLLDEATASLDSESDSEIRESISMLMQGRTTIMVGHRLSTIRHADQVLVLDKGKIVQRGTHDSLAFVPGRYRELYEADLKSIVTA